jgi:hypothetical protein
MVFGGSRDLGTTKPPAQSSVHMLIYRRRRQNFHQFLKVVYDLKKKKYTKKKWKEISIKSRKKKKEYSLYNYIKQKMCFLFFYKIGEHEGRTGPIGEGGG